MSIIISGVSSVPVLTIVQIIAQLAKSGLDAESLNGVGANGLPLERSVGGIPIGNQIFKKSTRPQNSTTLYR